MPNTREKLIELLKDGGVRDFPFNAALADHLIASGFFEELQNEAYDLGVDSALHNHFGLSWKDAAGLRKEIKRLQDAARWIPVSERLPEDGGVRDFPFNAALADHLIASGVTVQEGKPLEAFLHPIDAYKGLKAKYLVFKADTGGKVDNCFILRPDKDPAAIEALRAYASATDNETLAEDIYNWVGKGVTVQELDSERIIRCKDCVYYRPAEDWNGNKYDACYLKPDVCILQRKPTDFCSYAEQKLPEPPKGD